MSLPPLLVIDVQNGFVNSKSRHVLPLIARLVEHWSGRSAPIYMTQFVNRQGSQWERLIGWSRLRDEAEIALDPSIAVYAKYASVFRKDTYTAVVGPFLDDLRRQQWSEVVVCGIATDSCVLSTAIDLFEAPESLRPIVVSDACASQAGDKAHQAGLYLLGRLIGVDQLVDAETVVGMT